MAICRSIGNRNGLAFYGDAPFPFNVHGIQNLILEIPVLHEVALLNEPVCQGGLSMVNMGYDAKVTDIRGCYHII
jgi:hypothetical protein